MQPVYFKDDAAFPLIPFGNNLFNPCACFETAEEAKFEETLKAQQATRTNTATTRGRGRGRGRGARGGLMAAPPPTTDPGPAVVSLVAPPPPLGPVTISDEDDDPMIDSDDSDRDSDEISGDEDVYYGGYGRCYSCGKDHFKFKQDNLPKYWAAFQFPEWVA